MVAAAAVVDLLGGIIALLPHLSRVDPAISASLGETFDLLSDNGGALVSFYLLGGFVSELGICKRD